MLLNLQICKSKGSRGIGTSRLRMAYVSGEGRSCLAIPPPLPGLRYEPTRHPETDAGDLARPQDAQLSDDVRDHLGDRVGDSAGRARTRLQQRPEEADGDAGQGSGDHLGRPHQLAGWWVGGRTSDYAQY